MVLWVVWIWDGLETRRAADSAAISKATLTGVVKTLESRGLIARRVSDTDRRLVNLELTPSGVALMKELYPAFNAAEAEVVSDCRQKRGRTDRQPAIDRHRARGETSALSGTCGLTHRRSPQRVCALSLSKGARSHSTSGLRKPQPAFTTAPFDRLRAQRLSARTLARRLRRRSGGTPQPARDLLLPSLLDATGRRDTSLHDLVMSPPRSHHRLSTRQESGRTQRGDALVVKQEIAVRRPTISPSGEVSSTSRS